MKYIGIIPARMESKRLPGKPLVKIGNKTIIQRVYEQSIKCSQLNKVVVATDNIEIKKHVERFGEVILTSSKPLNGTERVGEALSFIKKKYDYILNIQGDEPFIKPSQIKSLIDICDGKNSICTLVKKIDDKKKILAPSIIKVKINSSNQALNFSRSMINNGKKNEYFKHICIYAFKYNILSEIIRLPKSRLEKLESLEQLRWLENNYKIIVNFTEEETFGIDTKEDLERANKLVSSQKQEN